MKFSTLFWIINRKKRLKAKILLSSYHMQKRTNKLWKEVKYSLLCLFFTNENQETMKINNFPPTYKSFNNTADSELYWFLWICENTVRMQFVKFSTRFYLPKTDENKLRDANSSNVRKCVSIHRHFLLLTIFLVTLLLKNK